MKTKVYDDGFIRVVRHVPEELSYKDVVFITFQTFTGRLSDSGFGTRFLKKLGVENFFVSHRGLSFYQKLSLEAFRGIFYQFVFGKRVFLYGSSLGGYASIYYSGAVNGQSIALSPRCSADPIYNEDFDDLVFNHYLMDRLPPGFVSEYDPIIAYDPYVEKDEVYIKQRVLPCYPRSKIFEIYNGLHPVGPVMNHSGVLKSFVMSAVDKGYEFDLGAIDPELNPAYSLKKARESLKSGDRQKLNFYIFKCLAWGGVPSLISVIRKAVERRVLEYGICAQDIPKSIKSGYVRKVFKESGGCSYQECIDLHLCFFEYDAALSVLDLKEARLGFSAATRELREKIVREKDWVSKLPSYPGFIE